MRAELVGCERARAHGAKEEAGWTQLGSRKRTGLEANTLPGEDPAGRHQGPGEAARAEGEVAGDLWPGAGCCSKRGWKTTREGPERKREERGS